MKAIIKCIFSFIILFFISLPVIGKIKLPAVVGDNMVLQQNTKVKIWGWSDKNKEIKILPSWSNKEYKIKISDKGYWCTYLDTPEASLKPFDIKISDGDDIVLNNVLIGEVWICSGQSNMEMKLIGNGGQPVTNSLENILEAGKYKDIIHAITIPRGFSDKPQEETSHPTAWLVSSPKTIANISAVAYFFAKSISKVLKDVPIGLVISSRSGSAIEEWMTEDDLKAIGCSIDDFNKLKNNPERRASNFYNSMICPIKGYTAKGFIWYQGESNRKRWNSYETMLKTMVSHWRNDWSNVNMPFYYVQIAPYEYEDPNGRLSGFLIEAQQKALKSIPNSGMITTTDIGNEKCIHPSSKEEIGFRLANLALAKSYGMNFLPTTGPMFNSVSYVDGKAIVNFKNAEKGLAPEFTQLDCFEIAGADKKFYPAKAMIIRGKTSVEVSSDKVPNPIAVRYAFINYPHGENLLKNTFNLPAAPFRTDNWNE